jgi:hypothetical protein
MKLVVFRVGDIPRTWVWNITDSKDDSAAGSMTENPAAQMCKPGRLFEHEPHSSTAT